MDGTFGAAFTHSKRVNAALTVAEPVELGQECLSILAHRTDLTVNGKTLTTLYEAATSLKTLMGGQANGNNRNGFLNKLKTQLESS